MESSNVNAIESTGSKAGSNVQALRDAGQSQARSSIDALTGAFDKALTGPGKSSFETPGAEMDFKNGLRSAITDIVEGNLANDEQRVKQGFEQLSKLLDELLRAQDEKQGAGGSEAPGAGQGGGAPSAAGGASPSQGTSGEGKPESLEELIRKLLELGVPKEMIAQLLQAAGLPADQVNQAMAKAGEGAEVGSIDAGNPVQGAGNTAAYDRNAMAA